MAQKTAGASDRQRPQTSRLRKVFCRSKLTSTKTPTPVTMRVRSVTSEHDFTLKSAIFVRVMSNSNRRSSVRTRLPAQGFDGASTMTTKERVHLLVDGLPEQQPRDAQSILEALHAHNDDPLARKLLTAPIDSRDAGRRRDRTRRRMKQGVPPYRAR